MPEKSVIYYTGETGFIGQHLIAALYSHVKFSSGFMGYDLSREHFTNATENDVIIHLAGVTHTRQEFDPLLIEANFILAKKIFTSRARIIYASSCSAKYDTSPYAQSKMYAEHLAAKHGNALGLRFFNVYGPMNNKGIVDYLLKAKYKSQLIIRGTELVRDYVFVEDVIEQILFYIKNFKTGIVEVGTGIGTKTIDLVSLYSELTGKVFDVHSVDALPSDPHCMVARRDNCKTTLREGLLKTINNQ